MRTPLVFILLAALALSACNPSANVNKNNSNGNSNAPRGTIEPLPPLPPVSATDPGFKACNPYYPLVPGSRRKYTVSYSSGISADATAVVYPWEENGQTGFKEIIQIVDSSGGYQIKQQIERHYVCDGDKVKILYEKTDSDVDNNKTVTEFFYRDPSYVMIEPSSLKMNATWSQSLKMKLQQPGQPPAEPDTPTFINFTVLDEKEIPLPIGKVKALGLYRKVGEAEINDYFVPGLGFVFRNAKEGNKWILKEYSGLKPVEPPAQ
ncbi:MAG TPA: hypothetical protein VJZ91_12050, partial [Blastocatellia bacterium]|nr:hypothetical protein [Blastocatellia bacterium]